MNVATESVEITPRGIRKVLNKYTPQRAIAEYIWNGYDAHAKEVRVNTICENLFDSIIGENIEYLADEIRLDDYVMNYSKPQGVELSDLAKKAGNPVVIYNPKELQMNTAFSKAFLLDEGGSKAGLPGNFFILMNL